MSILTIRPIDLLVHPFYKASMELVSGDTRSLPIDPRSLAASTRLKELIAKAHALGCEDLFAETAIQVEAQSDAEAFYQENNR